LAFLLDKDEFNESKEFKGIDLMESFLESPFFQHKITD